MPVSASGPSLERWGIASAPREAALRAEVLVELLTAAQLRVAALRSSPRAGTSTPSDALGVALGVITAS